MRRHKLLKSLLYFEVDCNILSCSESFLNFIVRKKLESFLNNSIHYFFKAKVSQFKKELYSSSKMNNLFILQLIEYQRIFNIPAFANFIFYL